MAISARWADDRRGAAPATTPKACELDGAVEVCTIGTLRAHKTAHLTIGVHLRGKGTQGTSAAVRSQQADSKPSNNHVKAPVAKQPAKSATPRLSLTAAFNHQSVLSGKTVRLTLRVRTTNHTTAHHVAVCERLPAGVSVVTAPHATVHDRHALDGRPCARTWWASPVRRVQLRRRHLPGAPSQGRLHLFTEDGFPEVELVTHAWTSPAGVRWYEIHEPHKPRALTGWVPARALTSLTAVHTRFVVDRRAERATLYRDGRAIWSARVGTGNASTPTPPGHYWVREKFPVPGDGLCGTRAFGTSDYSPYVTDWPEGGIVGIHGTDQPSLIPGHPSHGCIRIRNAAIQRLYPLMPI